MSEEANYFLIKGGVVKERLDTFFATRKAQMDARIAFTKEFGATRSLGKSRYLLGLQFLEVPVPAGWIRIANSDACYKPRKSKANQQIIERMRSLPLFGYQELQYAVLGEEDHFRFMQGMTIGFLCYERIGQSEVLTVPKLEEREKDENSLEATTNWVPPDDGCVLLKDSEYWALREAQEATA